MPHKDTILPKAFLSAESAVLNLKQTFKKKIVLKQIEIKIDVIVKLKINRNFH